jgi:nucleotide-binding universal stress UspA family protein
MNTSFESILIPVDLSINTELSVKKALELSDRGTIIHLLHVQSYPTALIPGAAKQYFTNATDRSEIENCLRQWKSAIDESELGVEVCTWVIPGASIQEAIEKKATQLAVDLIIISKNSHHSWFPFLNTVDSSRVVQNTGIPVLTVKPGSFHNKIRKVIVPVSANSVQDKMEIIASICKKFKVHIYLVTIMGNHSEPLGFYATSLLQLYKWVKTSIGCPVEYSVLKGRNKARAILNYAEKINADILLLYPETETRIGWMNTQISDVLPPSTKVEIFTVQPLHSLTT